MVFPQFLLVFFPFFLYNNLAMRFVHEKIDFFCVFFVIELNLCAFLYKVNKIGVYKAEIIFILEIVLLKC